MIQGVMEMHNLPIIAITMGDPAGIGAEIAVKTLSNAKNYTQARPFIIGDKDRIRESLKFTQGVKDINIIEDILEAKFQPGIIDVMHIPIEGVSEIPYGKLNAKAGKAAVAYIYKSIDLAKAKLIDAVVTGPINKEAMHMAGYTQYSGHTEIFAQKTNTKDYAMMLSVDDYYVVHVSTHCSLREACDRATKERVKKVIYMAQDLIQTYQIPNTTIAVAGLNPHSGEGGLFGTEEIEHIIPAIEEASAEGINVIGPIPPDSIFVRAARKEFQVIIVMYHDQGHIPVKIINFNEGINVTLGLPIIRTSVDHGTAFGRAGKGYASPASMEAALQMAARMAALRKPGV
jgi:4-hydroxythreonine-4-phosphate dehydrogenase